MSDEELLVHINYLRDDIKGLKASVEKSTDAIWVKIDGHSSEITNLRTEISKMDGGSSVTNNIVAGIVAAITSILVSLGIRR